MELLCFPERYADTMPSAETAICTLYLIRLPLRSSMIPGQSSRGSDGLYSSPNAD